MTVALENSVEQETTLGEEELIVEIWKGDKGWRDGTLGSALAFHEVNTGLILSLIPTTIWSLEP